jgi:hypothetical protein
MRRRGRTGFDPSDLSFDEIERLETEGAYGLYGDVELDRLEAIRRYHNIKSVAYKTVDMFSGITKKRLWLKNGTEAKTDGHEIRVPFVHEDFYRLVERQLAHILFRSDAKAKQIFVRDYATKVGAVAKKMNVDLDVAYLQKAIDHIITVLEKRRVTSLWRLLYPGSYDLMREMDKASVEGVMPTAHAGLLAYITCIEGDPDAVGSGELDRFRPYIEEAFRKVYKRGFSATLAVSKWLVMQLVNEIIRDLKDLPPPSPPMPMRGGDQRMPGDGASTDGSGGGSGDGEQQQKQQGKDSGEGGGKNQDDPNGDQPDDKDQDVDSGALGALQGDFDDSADPEGGNGGGAPENDSEGTEGEDDSEGAGGGGADRDEDGEREEPWNPEPPPATGEERTQALKELLNRLGDPPQDVKDPVKESKFTKNRHSPKAQATASQALKADVNNADKFESGLDSSEQEMSDIIDQAMRAMRQKRDHDEWLQKDAMAKISFVDKDDDVTRVALSFEDQQTVHRLRAMFHRVMGKRKNILEDAGTEIDVQAYIERMLTNVPIPCFRGEGIGQGFKSMLLLDRSGSMHGSKTEQCERAGRIIRRALDFPFVETTVWGFSSSEPGQISLIRHNPRKDVVLKTGERGSGGMTPLHVAIRLGVRELERGTESKQLFVLTDGFPTHRKRDGKTFGKEQLMLFIREEVQRARTRGINVTGILIGTRGGWMNPTGEVRYDMSNKELAYMFGPKRNWRTVHPDRIGNDLIQAVARSFVDFLKRR